MAFTHKDLLDLNHVDMADADIVTSGADIQKLYDDAANMSIAGMKHSQGGHTALAGGHMLITETMNRKIEFGPRQDSGLPGKDKLEWVRVDAGMTWAELHYHLQYRNAVPLVHQSSAHFTIGGSLSVNCHGRETAIGAVSGTVMSVDILTGNGVTIQASPTSNSELFKAVIGGYGACGIILKAQLRVTQNVAAYRFGYNISFTDYEVLLGLMRDPFIPKWKLHPDWRLPRSPTGDDATAPFASDDALLMHHGWINVSKVNYLGAMIGYDTYQADAAPPESGAPDPMKHETWGESELLRAGWVAAQEHGDMRTKLWEELKNRTMASNGVWSRLDYMREAITFTSSSGKTEYGDQGQPLRRKGVAMLQEYFVPIDKFAEFMNGYKEAFPYNDNQNPPQDKVQLLSTTTRYVKGDAEQVYLSYAPDGKPRVSIALEAYVPFNGDGKTPTTDATGQFQAAIQAALSCGGSYYLPYYKFATPVQFNQAYDVHSNFAALKAAIDKHNPSHRFSNQFLTEHKIHT
jgi:FAD binding domain